MLSFGASTPEMLTESSEISLAVDDEQNDASGTALRFSVQPELLHEGSSVTVAIHRVANINAKSLIRLLLDLVNSDIRLSHSCCAPERYEQPIRQQSRRGIAANRVSSSPKRDRNRVSQ